MAKSKKQRNKFEVLDVDELLLLIDNKNKEVNQIIEKISGLRYLYLNEWNRFDQNSKPDKKAIDSFIKEVEPLYDEYHLMVEELEEIKKQIISITGLREDELKAFRDHWFYTKKLNQARDFIGVAL